MRFDDLVEKFHTQPYFDLSSAVTLFNEPRRTTTANLHRWRSQGKIIELRRGIYSLAERYRSAPLRGPLVANVLYTPSYLSGLWVLSWFGIIPEKTETYTSCTTRVTRTFATPVGTYEYRTIKASLFFGYASSRILEAEVAMADPEKALLDYWYLEKGEWTPERMESMRFNPGEMVKDQVLQEHARRTSVPRMLRAVSAWTRYREGAR